MLFVCLGGLLVTAPSAFALTRAQADAVAFAALKPSGRQAAVYGLPSALPAGTAVSDAGPGPGERFVVTDNGPGKGATLQATVRRTTLSAPGWLFWEDPNAGASFPHASRLLLVDDATGKVAWTQTLAWWPLVNDKPAAFYLHSNRAAYRVTAGVERQASLATGSDTEQASYPHDCLIALYNAGDTRSIANFGGDASAMVAFAEAHGMPAVKTSLPSALVSYATSFVDKGCTDIVVFLAGHGTPAPSSGLPGGTEEPTVIVASNYVAGANGTTTTVTDSAVTASDLKGIVKQFSGKATFKFLVNACYAGRFVTALDTDPGVALVAASAAGDEIGREWVDQNDTEANHPGQAGTWTLALIEQFDAILDGKVPGLSESTVQKAKDDLANALDIAAKLNDAPATSMDKTVTLRLTHPIAVLNPHVGEVSPTTPTRDLDEAMHQELRSRQPRHRRRPARSRAVPPDPSRPTWSGASLSPATARSAN